MCEDPVLSLYSICIMFSPLARGMYDGTLTENCITVVIIILMAGLLTITAKTMVGTTLVFCH